MREEIVEVRVKRKGRKERQDEETGEERRGEQSGARNSSGQGEMKMTGEEKHSNLKNSTR